VDLRERLARVQHVADGILDAQRSLAPHDVLEVVALEVLHHDERRPVGQLAEVDHARDVLALDPHGGARLAPEPFDDLGTLRGLAQQELQRDALAEVDVRRGKHDAHTAGTDLTLEAVLAGDEVTSLYEHRSHAPIIAARLLASAQLRELVVRRL
jgi:hypothetical protein